MTSTLDRCPRSLASRVLAGSLILTAIAGPASARQLTDCQATAKAVEFRFSSPSSADNHWGDIFMLQSGQPPATSAPFPPPGGVTTEFKSLCSGIWMPGRAGLKPGSLGVAADRYYREPQTGPWLTPDCDVTWNPGFPLNLDMRFGPAAGDYPPKHLDLASSSSPLLSALGSSYGWPTALAERALIGNEVDMVTGSPLLQATDLELPFGSATFRWTRTFSEVPQTSPHQYEFSTYSAGWDDRFRDFPPQAQYWDWAGQGWMLGVSPLLLIDAGHWGINDLNGTRCYFLPDAHHSIPFLKLEGGSGGVPRYEAPPRFDAVLGHNETYVQIQGVQMPTEWYVWTHRRSIKYIFAPVYDDTGWTYDGNRDNSPVREHALPGPILDWPCSTGVGNGLGTPYYAVVKAIEDLQGNRIEFDYSDFTRDIIVTPPLLPPGAAEAIQNSQGKGQIRRIRLTRNGATSPRETVWTLIPVYREFGGSEYVDNDPANNPEGYAGGVYRIPDNLSPAERFENQRAIDSVYAYRGEVAAPPQSSRLTLGYDRFRSVESREDPLTALHAILNIDAGDICSLPADWEHRIRYLYADGTETFRQKVSVLDYHSKIGYASLAREWLSSPPLQSPRLLLSRVTTRTTISGQTSESTRDTLYSYRAQHWDPYFRGNPNDTWRIQGVWSSEKLNAIRKEITRQLTWTGRQAMLADWPLSLLTYPRTETVPVPRENDDDQLKYRKLIELADLELVPWDNDDGGYTVPPGNAPTQTDLTYTWSPFCNEIWQKLIQVLPSAGYRPLLSPDGPAIIADRSSGDGTYDRVYRFLLVPDDWATQLNSDYQYYPGTAGQESLGINFRPQSLLFHHPYRMAPFALAVPTGGLNVNGGAVRTPGLGDPVWAVVIDSHRSMESAAWTDADPLHRVWKSTSELQAALPGDVDRKRLPTARRLVLLNAAGYVLHERRWILDGFGSGAFTSQGLWEERTYDWNVANSMPAGDFYLKPAIGRLLEVRTVGWSAAGTAGAPGTSKSSDGLIHIYAYDNRETFKGSMEIAGIGIKKGTHDQLPWDFTNVAWAKQFLRDPDRKDLVRYEIDYFSPPAQLYAWDKQFSQEELEATSPTQAITYRGYHLEEMPGAQPWEQSTKRVLAEVTIRPPVPAPVTSELRFPVDITRIDYSKTPYTDRWHGYGEVTTLDGLLLFSQGGPHFGTPPAQFFYDLSRQDGSGNVVLTAIDFDGDHPEFTNRLDLQVDAGYSSAPQCPPTWERVPGPAGSTAPLNHWTVTRYSSAGPTRAETNRHSGTIWVYGHDVYPDPAFLDYPWESTRTYSHVRYNANGNVIGIEGPGQIAYYGPDVSPNWNFNQSQSWGAMNYTVSFDRARRVLTSVQSVNWDITPPPPTTPPTPITITGTEPFIVLAELGLEGPSGAPTSIKVTSGSEAREARIAYTNLGEIQRQLHPDATIIRNVYDPFGKLLRVYRGTDDHHWYWGTMIAPQDPCATPSSATDNLVLVEKRTYGTGVSDANQVIRTRSYRAKPSDQYQSCSTSTHNEDEIGWSTEFKFDWRMRPVATINRAEGPDTAPALLHTATYVDTLSRTRFVAVYGPNGPATTVNPADPNLGPFDPLPTAEAILAAAPLRLSETVYNARGQVAEQREYDVNATSQLAYTATITHYDFADRPIRVLQPGGREERSVYNAKGQLAAQSTYAAGTEIARTEHDYDDEGNAVITRSLERTGTSGADLTSANSVTTFTHKWYDQDKRLVATADWGTASPTINPADSRNGKYATGPAPTRTTAAPVPVYTGSRVTDVNRGSTPDWVKITCFEYDAQGRESAIIHPVTIPASGPHPHPPVTRKYYNGFGELTRQIDNADTADTLDPSRRVTAYRYDDGRLMKIAALLYDDNTDPDWESQTGHVQITELKYEASVVGPTGADFDPPTFNNAWVSEVRFPNPATGLPSADNFLKFKYYITGEIAEREDPRGTKIRYRYDELGRCTRTEIDTSTYQAPGGVLPIDRVARIDYAYDTLGNLTKATAWRALGTAGGTPPATELIAETEFSYDHHGNLLWERQQHGAAAGSSSPTMSYQWDWHKYESGLANSNHNRLITMTYPDRDAGAGVSRRVLDFEYGDYSTQPAIDDALGRITGIRATGLTPAAARYEYAGQGRRTQLRLADLLSGSQPDTAAAIQRLNSSSFTQAGLDGLDHFGRLIDLHFQGFASGAPTTTKHRYTFGYDASDNRTFAQVKQVPWGSVSNDNIRSFVWSYDGLDRLTGSELGQLTSTATPAINPTTPLPRLTEWNLDKLGNWTGHFNGTTQTDPGRHIEGDVAGNGVPATEDTSHATDLFNRIGSISVGTGGTPTTTPVVYDRAGNLTIDGTYIYQYDGLNRLVQVNLRGGVTLDPQTGQFSGTPGPWLLHHTYDGLGRLIKAQRPWPQPSPTETRVRTEHFYYDGVRRIQEVFTDPVPDANTDNDGVEISDEDSPPAPQTITWTEREYIWGPDSVDELVCQITPSSTTGGPSTYTSDYALYALTQTNGTISGLIDSTGAVKAQYTFDPYGEVLHAETATGMPRNRIGHQGLFFDRLDAPTTSPQLGRGYAGVYHNRNRTYAPGLGRFLQKDLNESGVRTSVASAFRGIPASVSPARLDALNHYADGLSLFGYVATNPIRATDPSGLELPGLFTENVTMALRYHEAYERGKTVLGIVKQLVMGASLESVVMGLAFEVVADKIGGEVAGKVLSGAGSVLKKMKPWLARAGSSIQFRGKTISFDSMGFPNFSPFVHDRVQIRMTGNNSRDQFLADTEFFQKGGVKPPGEWVWHHSQDLTTMELIPFEVNDAVRHMGGASIIRTMLDD